MTTPKLKHLRHPVRTAVAAAKLIAMYIDIWKFGRSSATSYRDDVRFDLTNVSRGFAPRIEASHEDTEILQRICAAYKRATEQQRFAPDVYQASGWWQQVRSTSLGPVLRALEEQDIASLAAMYRKFYRNSCSTGLVSLPYGMSGAYFHGKIDNLRRRYYLGDALHSIDYWKDKTGGAFSLEDLAGPDIGNPFGVLIDNVLVRAGSAYQHYAAHRVLSSLNSTTATVVEIGGGYGGMAYYLLRGNPNVRYIDVDVPESLALTSYYLLRSFPHLKFLLYGEADLTSDAISQADVVLIPPFAMNSLASESVDVTFSSHATSDISQEALQVYLQTIARITTGCFLYIGDARGVRSIAEAAGNGAQLFQLQATQHSAWNSHKCSNADEVECIFMPTAALDRQPLSMSLS